MSEHARLHFVPGMRLPSAGLPATDGALVDPSTLPGFSLIAVYPWTGRPGMPDPPGWDDIPGAHGSTPELEGFRDRFRRFEKLGARVFGLSLQDTAHQAEAVARLGLPFSILSDSRGDFSGPLRLPRFSAGTASYLTRLTILARGGYLVHVFHPVPDPAGHAEDVLVWLDRHG